MRLVLATALALTISSPAFTKTMTPAQSAVAAAIADPARPQADRDRDAARKPSELLAYAGVKPGDTVLDFIMGGGYVTRLLAKTVGPKGHVYAYQPAEFIQFMAKYGTDQDTVAAAYPNVTAFRPSLGAFAVPKPVDVIITVQNYHDLHLKIAPPTLAGKIDQTLFAALKPGGTLLVVDHYAVAGAGLESAQTLHRIDAATARAEIEKAGFVFDGEIPLYRNPDDPRTASVFDPSIRGKTDQFVYRFRKPK